MTAGATSRVDSPLARAQLPTNLITAFTSPLAIKLHGRRAAACTDQNSRNERSTAIPLARYDRKVDVQLMGHRCGSRSRLTTARSGGVPS